MLSYTIPEQQQHKRVRVRLEGSTWSAPFGLDEVRSLADTQPAAFDSSTWMSYTVVLHTTIVVPSPGAVSTEYGNAILVHTYGVLCFGSVLSAWSDHDMRPLSIMYTKSTCTTLRHATPLLAAAVRGAIECESRQASRGGYARKSSQLMTKRAILAARRAKHTKYSPP